MKKTKIEGELKVELLKQVESISAIRSSIEALSKQCYEHEKRMWKQLDKEFPNHSINCGIGTEGDDLIFTDRLSEI